MTAAHRFPVGAEMNLQSFAESTGRRVPTVHANTVTTLACRLQATAIRSSNLSADRVHALTDTHRAMGARDGIRQSASDQEKRQAQARWPANHEPMLPRSSPPAVVSKGEHENHIAGVPGFQAERPEPEHLSESAPPVFAWATDQMHSLSSCGDGDAIAGPTKPNPQLGTPSAQPCSSRLRWEVIRFSDRRT